LTTVVVTDHAWPSVDIERAILADAGAGVIVAPPDPEELARLVQDSDAILTNWRTIPEAPLRRAGRCVAIGRYGIGVDNIPVEVATELGIVVANVPDFCVDEVSDQVIALLLSCARRIPELANAVAAGEWGLARAAGIERLRGGTLGLVGFGRTARAVAPKAAVFGLRVLAYTPRLHDADVPESVERAPSLDALLATSDYVSLHMPATPETAGLIGAPEFARMKPTAYLINTARGALVDEEALAQAVRDGTIAGAGLDVLSAEPPPDGHPLIDVRGVIVTPHSAFYSETAILEVRQRAAANVARALRGETPHSVVNQAVLASPFLRIAMLDQ
jgi:D-3-phosphoglycerate dehydrogenase